LLNIVSKEDLLKSNSNFVNVRVHTCQNESSINLTTQIKGP